MEQSVSQIAAIAVAYSSTEPSNKEVLWFDTSIVTDNPFEAIKVYDKQSLQWKLVNRTPEQILIDLRTVDGEGSGLDADTLQGYTPEDLISSGGGVPMLNTGELLVGQADGTGTAQTVGGIATIQPDGTLVQSPSAIDHTLLSNIGTNSHAQIDTHIADTANPHGVTAAQVGNTTAQWNANQLDGNTLNIGTPGAPEDGYTITWDNTAGEFILSAGGGGNTIYTADDTVGSGRVLTLTDSVTFSGGVTIHEGADTLSSSSHTKMYDGDTTPNLLWDWRNNGDVYSSGTGVIYGNITSDSSSNTPFTVRRDSSTVNNSLFFPQQLKNSSSSYVDYVQFSTRILSNTASSESGQFTINLKNSGSNVAIFDSGNANGTVLNVSHATGQKFAVSGFITIDSTGQTTIEGGGTRTLAVKRANTTGSTGIHFDNSIKTAGEIYTSYSGGNAYNMTFALDNGSGLTTVLQVTPTKTNLKNQVNAANLPTYADDAAAGAGGLITGDLYVETTSGNRYVASKS